MANKGSSASAKEAYKRYKAENRKVKNKIKRLQRHIKKYPGDKQALEVLSDPTKF